MCSTSANSASPWKTLGTAWHRAGKCAASFGMSRHAHEANPCHFQANVLVDLYQNPSFLRHVSLVPFLTTNDTIGVRWVAKLQKHTDPINTTSLVSNGITHVVTTRCVDCSRWTTFGTGCAPTNNSVLYRVCHIDRQPHANIGYIHST